jgi:hypothetical protein
LSEHNHELKHIGIPVECKEHIDKLFSTGVKKTKAILGILKEKGILEPTAKQLTTYLKKLRVQSTGD